MIYVDQVIYYQQLGNDKNYFIEVNLSNLKGSASSSTSNILDLASTKFCDFRLKSDLDFFMKKEIFRKDFEVNWEKTNICIVTFQSNLYDSPLSLLVLTSLSN